MGLTERLPIKDTLAEDQNIVIKAFQLPILNTALLEKEIDPSQNLNMAFESTRLRLMEVLEGILV